MESKKRGKQNKSEKWGREFQKWEKKRKGVHLFYNDSIKPVFPTVRFWGEKSHKKKKKKKKKSEVRNLTCRKKKKKKKIMVEPREYHGELGC